MRIFFYVYFLDVKSTRSQLRPCNKYYNVRNCVVLWTMNKDLFGVQYNKKLSKGAFFWYVSNIRSTTMSTIFLTELRFSEAAIDVAKVQDLKLKIKHKRKYIPSKKFFCPFTGRARFRSRFFGGLSRFAFRDLAKEGVFLAGVFRSGW